MMVHVLHRCWNTTTVCTSATEVRMTGPWWNWDPNGGPIAVDNGNGTWTFTFCPAPTADMELEYA